MYSRLKLAQKYLHYYLTAANGKGHGTHSPFVFDFIIHVLNDGRRYEDYVRIEELRQRLKRDPRVLEIEDMGAGSALEGARAGAVEGAGAGAAGVDGRSTVANGAGGVGIAVGPGVADAAARGAGANAAAAGAAGRSDAADAGAGAMDGAGAMGPGSVTDRTGVVDAAAGGAVSTAVMRQRNISSIARNAAKPARLGQLLYRIARYYQPSTILELGTSLGISTAYLAAGNPQARVWTIEGAASVAEAAGNNLRSLELNVEQVVGNFDQVLAPTLQRMGPVGLAFVDGNHRREPTLRYFNQLMDVAARPGILIFDDIHWSAEMEEAWEVIRRDPRVYLTVDLFFIGLVFLREEFKVKQEFVIRF